MVWKLAEADTLRAGEPLAEWAYRTPSYPDGLTRSALTWATPLEQQEVAEFWFRLNFMPYDADRPWFTLGVSTLDGPDLLAPEHGSSLFFLEEEFFGALPAEVIGNLASQLLQESPEWSPVPSDPPEPLSHDSAVAARIALERVQADLVRVGIGHNQGPPLDPAIAAEIRDAVRMGLQAVSTESAGKDAASSAASGLITLAGSVGSAFVQGVAKKAGEDTEPLIKHGLAVLFHHMLEAAVALLHWVASMPPGPLL